MTEREFIFASVERNSKWLNLLAFGWDKIFHRLTKLEVSILENIVGKKKEKVGTNNNYPSSVEFRIGREGGVEMTIALKFGYYKIN